MCSGEELRQAQPSWEQNLMWGLLPLICQAPSVRKQFLAVPLGLWPPPIRTPKAGWGHVALPRPCWLQFLNPERGAAVACFPRPSHQSGSRIVGWGKQQPLTWHPLPPAPRHLLLPSSPLKSAKPEKTASSWVNRKRKETREKRKRKKKRKLFENLKRARFHIEQLQTEKSEKAQPSPRFQGACWGLSPAREGKTPRPLSQARSWLPWDSHLLPPSCPPHCQADKGRRCPRSACRPLPGHSSVVNPPPALGHLC
ncbi:interleukin-34 isoform X1 [Neofelis nebulosa]|uniref:interleukin-34 isoform X1 n=1 Tax=Neofelis nebulosa TaxID=61452 RepID=UPI00272C9F51|nr:interleukin-34 isoform X1 [Neofelis nebulosa]